jgi:hypothetical protein
MSDFKGASPAMKGPGNVRSVTVTKGVDMTTELPTRAQIFTHCNAARDPRVG